MKVTLFKIKITLLNKRCTIWMKFILYFILIFLLPPPSPPPPSSSSTLPLLRRCRHPLLYQRQTDTLVSEGACPHPERAPNTAACQSGARPSRRSPCSACWMWPGTRWSVLVAEEDADENERKEEEEKKQNSRTTEKKCNNSQKNINIS